MMAVTVTLPDPIAADQAALWPELVSTPAVIDFGAGQSLFVETYFLRDTPGVPVAHVRLLRDGQVMAEVGLSATQVRALLAVFNAADRELQAAAPNALG